jgi:hypothetical protein
MYIPMGQKSEDLHGSFRFRFVKIITFRSKEVTMGEGGQNSTGEYIGKI